MCVWMYGERVCVWKDRMRRAGDVTSDREREGGAGREGEGEEGDIVIYIYIYICIYTEVSNKKEL